MRSVSAMVNPARGREPPDGPSASVAQRSRRGDRGVDRRAAGGHRGQQRRAVGDAARHRTRMVKRRGQGDDPVEGEQTVGGLERARPAARRGDAQRATRVRAQRRRGHARGQRRRAAAARASGDAVKRPRVADLVGGAARRELVGVGVAERHHALAAQPGPHLRVGAGDVALQHPAGRGEGKPRHPVQVLEPQRDAAQRGRIAGSQAFIGRTRALMGQLGIQTDPGVDGVRGALEGRGPAVALLDPRQAGLGQLHR